MTYTVTGILLGTEYVVQWKDGKVRGTQFIKDVIEAQAKAYKGIGLGPVGQYYSGPPLKDPLSALFLMREVFDEIVDATGDVPEAADVPEGAVS